MYCKKCGNEISEGVLFCSNCGTAVEGNYEVEDDMDFGPSNQPQNGQANQQGSQYNYQPQNGYQFNNQQGGQPNYQAPNGYNGCQQPVNDKGGFLWGVLGCCIPVVGLILFLVWKDQKPKTAKAAGIGALVSVGLWILYVILAFAVGILGAAGSVMY